MQTLIILRGPPGSGKSTLARKLIAEGKADAHFEADMFFELDGTYKFDATRLYAAHKWCQRHAFAALDSGKSVIVSNTFVKKRDMKEYIEYAESRNIPVVIEICRGSFKNVHNVPVDVVERMQRDFQE